MRGSGDRGQEEGAAASGIELRNWPCVVICHPTHAQKAAHGRGTEQQGLNSGYNLRMAIAILGMRILEVMFFAGLVGSAIVVIISFVEDGKELFGED